MTEFPQAARASSSTEADRAQCSAIMSARGIEGGVAWLNARTRFRVTGLYQVERSRLQGSGGESHE